MRGWRRGAGLILVGLMTVPSPATAGGRVAAAEWTHPGYGPGNTHYNPNESRLNAGTVSKLSRRWTVTTPATSDYCSLQSPPLASAGRLVTTDPTGLTAYAATTGKRLWHWTFPVLNPGRANREKFGEVALSGGLVIALTNPCEFGPGQFAYLTALDVATGEQRWRVPMDQYTNIMAVDKGVAAVGNWGGFADGPQFTAGYRVSDGTPLWNTPGYRLAVGVSAGGRLLLRSADDTAARAVSITTGKTLWSTPKPWSPQAASPAGDRFLVTTDGTGTTSVDAATGAVQWSTKHQGGLADDGRHIYLTYNRIVETYDAETGRKLRIFRLASHGGQPVRAGGLLYLTVDAGNPIAILDPKTGRTVAAYPEMKILAMPPVIVNGWLYTTNGETLRAYTPRFR
jgi:outer membrane protein assembly factor BamB